MKAIAANVAVGSKAEMSALKYDFRFTPESGLKSDIARGLTCANSDVATYSITSLANPRTDTGPEHAQRPKLAIANPACRLGVDFDKARSSTLGKAFDK
jgi:hypothetical protein